VGNSIENMFEYHCWITIDHQEFGRLWENGEIEGEEYYRQIDIVVEKLKYKIDELHAPLKDQCKLIKGTNGQITLHFSGLRNHYNSEPLEIVEWIRDNAPYSYGLLYIHSDWDSENAGNFVVYRLARNEITKFKDNLLSPYPETLEKGYYDDEID